MALAPIPGFCGVEFEQIVREIQLRRDQISRK